MENTQIYLLSKAPQVIKVIDIGDHLKTLSLSKIWRQTFHKPGWISQEDSHYCIGMLSTLIQETPTFRSPDDMQV